MAVLTLHQAAPLLHQAYLRQRLIPFIGAGFSQPLGLPQWDELMGWMGDALEYDRDLFKLHGSAPQLAHYFDLAHPDRLPWFIARMTERFHSDAVDDRRRRSIQHQALARCDFRAIYTTNFERHIERALMDAGKRAFTVARDVDFGEPVPADTCAVYKFHGDLEFPATIVLTEAQFFERFDLDAAPDLRLRTDLLANVFLFIGYSFSDINIRYIWHRMDMMRRKAGISAGHRCYWVTFGAGPVQPTLLDPWNVDVVELDGIDKSQSVVDLLDALRTGGTP